MAAEITVQFGVTSSPFGAPTGWVPTGPATKSTPKERATAEGNLGNEAASKTYGDIFEWTQEFVAASATVAPTVPPVIGSLLGEVILTSIVLNTSNTDFVRMTLTGHQHTKRAHADTLNQCTHGLSVSAAFGAIDFAGGTAGDAADIESSTLTISCQHLDYLDADGQKHLCGNNHTAKASGSTTWIGTPTTPVGAGWDQTNQDNPEATTDFIKNTYTYEKGLTLAAPA